MKRSSIDAGPPLKRQASDHSATEIGPGDVAVLRHQNRSLALELVRYKRQIAESREELDMIRGRSREMESLVSAIQRAWSQLDIDASMLLDSLGDPEIPEQDIDSNELLVRLMSAGSSSTKVDPTDLSDLPQLDVDQWTSADQIEQERLRVEKEQEEEALNAEFGGKLEENLAAHANFTLQLLERLCTAIGEAGTLAQAPEVINALTEAKALHADRLLLTDRITKMSSEIVSLSAKLHTCERQKLLLERDLFRAQTAVTELTNRIEAQQAVGGGDSQGSSSTAAETKDSGDHSANTATGAGPDAMSTHAKERETALTQKIAIMELQLRKSEEQKSKVEMELTKRLSNPMTSNSSSGVADVLKSTIETLRADAKKLVGTQNTDLSGMQDKLNNLELAFTQLEASCNAKCKEVAGQAEQEIKSMRASRDAMQSTLFRANADLAINSQLKTEVAELHSLEAAQRAEAAKMTERIRILTESQEMLQTHLAASRSREAALEAKLGGGDAVVDGETLTQAQARAAEALKELEHARSSINDLILEIDAVSAAESNSREQTTRTLKAMTDSQNTQRSLSEDNARLHDQISDLQRRHTDMESRLGAASGILKQQEQIIANFTARENSMMGELQALRVESRALQGIKRSNDQQLGEMQTALFLSAKDAEDEKLRSKTLQERCNALTESLAEERSLKMQAEREAKPKPQKVKVEAGSSLSSADASMLDMTLGMLRCSVCQDRFKGVCLTRCFHLFCKECVDDVIRTRNRKCPMCGDKFSDSEVRQIFFGATG